MDEILALNLYAGVGGNRKLWPKNVKVTAVEMNPEVAAVYQKLYPDDIVVVGDAHEYLQKHGQDFDFIWASPPCPTHSAMVKATRHKNKPYPDMKLYQEIIWLQHHFKGKYIIENVKPYYTPLIAPTAKVARHQFWSNCLSANVGDFVQIPEKIQGGIMSHATLKGKAALHEWLDIHFDEVIDLGTTDPAKILRNCVHPKVGQQLFKLAFSPGQERIV